MDRFMSGIIGVCLGFTVFLPSYLFAKSVTEAGIEQADTVYLIPIFLGLILMFSAPLVFWVLLPTLEKVRS